MAKWNMAQTGGYDYRDSHHALQGYVLRSGKQWLGVPLVTGQLKYFPTIREAQLYVETMIALES